MAKERLTIGQVAGAAGVNVETIRYYQRRGLILEPQKPVNGYRIYPQATISRLSFIKRAQALGFTLEEITKLLDLGDGKCEETQEIARQKLEQIATRMHDLEAMAQVLENLLCACDTKMSAHQECPIIEALVG